MRHAGSVFAGITCTADLIKKGWSVLDDRPPTLFHLQWELRSDLCVSFRQSENVLYIVLCKDTGSDWLQVGGV